MKTTGVDEYTGPGGVTTQVAQPSTAVVRGDTTLASNDSTPADDPVMGHLARTDLSDLPRRPNFLRGSADALVQALVPGTWVRISGLNRRTVSLKVAWLSADRSALLLVRHPDARVIARQMNQIRALIDQGRLRLLQTDQQASGS
jgi:hypothetical protein